MNCIYKGDEIFSTMFRLEIIVKKEKKNTLMGSRGYSI